MSSILRCYVYGNDKHWEAICVDLDIATFARSMDEAKQELTSCIEMYFESLEELSSEERLSFLKRRSPWHLRMKFAVMAWLTKLRGNVLSKLPPRAACFETSNPSPLPV